MRRNVDAWWPHVREIRKDAGKARDKARSGLAEEDGGEDDAGIEAIVMTASGCGVTVKEYGHLLRHDPAYAGKAARISELTKDISEIIEAESQSLARLLGTSIPDEKKPRVAFHSPCTLQHGMKIRGVVGKNPPGRRFSIDSGPGFSSLLRISRNLFHSPARAIKAIAGKQGQSPPIRLPRTVSLPPISAASCTYKAVHPCRSITG